MTHQAPGLPPVPCLRRSHGYCAICERIEVGGPDYSEHYRKLFHPEEFPEEPPAVVSASVTIPQGVDSTPAPPDEGKPCCGGQPPGLLVKAGNFTKAVVTHVAAGMPAADAATVSARWATCRACEMFDAEHVVCRACGCRLAIKIRMGMERCPIGKW